MSGEMFFLGQRVNVLTKDLNFLIDSGTITNITPETKENYGTYEVTLDENKEIMSIVTNEIERIQRISETIEENESNKSNFKSFLNKQIFGIEYGTLILVVFFLCFVIFGIYSNSKLQHTTPKIVPEKTQIQIWTDEMAKLEIEKADHYQRQKYLRSEDKKQVNIVKNIDKKINELKDKIHLYVNAE